MNFNREISVMCHTGNPVITLSLQSGMDYFASICERQIFTCFQEGKWLLWKHYKHEKWLLSLWNTVGDVGTRKYEARGMALVPYLEYGACDIDF